MAQYSSKYSFELWTPGGQLIADLGGRAKDRMLTMSRNEAEVIGFKLDMNELEDYCRKIRIAPSALLIPGQTEVRVRRLGTYICGGQLLYMVPHVSAGSQTIECRATGFLNLFDQRYTGTTPSGTVNETFTATQATTIATTLITQSQALTNGSYGVTIGTQATVGVHDRTYSRTNIKSALQDLTRLQSGSFDMQFTYDKVFKTYSSIGSIRNDIIFEYPKNIIDVQATIDATAIKNEVIALGQGNGAYAQAFAMVDDTTSQSTYKLRQDVFIANGTDNSDNGITDAANARLSAYSLPFQVPALIVDGNQAPYITDYGIGDRVIVKVGTYGILSNINGQFRIEKISLDLSDTDNEEITLQVSA